MAASKGQVLRHRELHGVAEERVDERAAPGQRQLTEVAVAHDLERELGSHCAT